MRPYKSNQLYKKVAEDLDLSESLVDNVINFFYTELRNEVGELNHLRIKIPDLGTFTVRENHLKFYKNKRLNLETEDFKEYEKLKQKLLQIDKLLEQSKEEEQRRLLTKNKRDEFIKNLEK